MKCLLLAPLRYPFIESIEKGLLDNGVTLKSVDYLDFFSPTVNHFVDRFTGLPKKIKNNWEDPYAKKANERYREIFNEFKPDLVFIYNNQLILPELLEEFRKKARIAFMLGDNPLYTPTSIYNLHILFNADYIISPDTLWRDQLAMLGIKNVVFDCLSFDEDVCYPMDVTNEQLDAYQSDFIFVGSAAKTNWGYKRALFLSLFKDFDLRAYISGEGFERWTNFFPGLDKKVIHHDRFDAAFNNLVYNCSKIAPIEQVPSLFNGIHPRVLDALGAGILPLCEYAKDIEDVFVGIDVPFIRDYREAKEVATYWLYDGDKRKETVELMRTRILEEYSPAMVMQRMLEKVFRMAVV